MSELGFGQPPDGVMQMAYTVQDMHRAIDYWVGELGVGPWFLLERFSGEHPVYRGRPSEANVAIAMSFAGHMNVELIQPNDDHPSVYREAIAAGGYGFHHWGIACDDVDREAARREAAGLTIAFRAGVPTGGDVVYLDTHGALPGFIELIPVTAGMNETFTHFYRACTGWDGSDPVRPFG